MSSFLKFLVCQLISLFTALNIFAQGCSDAGFCTVDHLQPGLTDSGSVFFHSVKAGISQGAADHSIAILAPYIDYNWQITKRTGVNTKLTALSQSGNNITTFGLSDIFFIANYKFSEVIKSIIGIKIPLANANKKRDGLTLPMDYQSSLGTFDIIAGLSAKFKNFEMVTALQHPLTQNENEYFSTHYTEESILSKFQTTNKYQRSGDVLFRASYIFKITEIFKITPGLLPIWHLANDKFTNYNGETEEIKGSKGLTLNAIAYFDFTFNKQNTLQLSLGAPLITRDTRPDGLTRSYVINFEYGVKF